MSGYDAHSVPCPRCKARKGAPCTHEDGTIVGPDISHSVRAVEALKAQERAQEPPDHEGEPFFGGFASSP